MRTSIAKWLIAKWLLDGPKTGYELLKLYEQAFGRASPGTIYPILTQMEKKGLVRKEGDKYALAEDGRRLLEDLERRRVEIMEESRKRLLALADLLDDERLRRFADYLPVTERVHPAVLDVLSDVELLAFELGEKAIPVLEEVKKKLERLSGASSRM